MELRHLRYFVAVAEEGNLTLAAKRRLNTAQPSLSRQIRELEVEVGAELMTRSTRGIELTAAGRVFLDHARLALAQVEAAASAARRAAHPEQRTLALGFLSGCEPEWLPAVMHVLRDELPKIEITISSKHSPQLADDLASGRLDAAFMRAEVGHPDLGYKVLITEPLIVVLPCARWQKTISGDRASTCARLIGSNIFPWLCHSWPRLAGWRCCRISPAISLSGRLPAGRLPGRRLRSTWSWVATSSTIPPC